MKVIIVCICLWICVLLDGSKSPSRTVARSSRLFQHSAASSKLVLEEYQADNDQLLNRFLIEQSPTEANWIVQEVTSSSSVDTLSSAASPQSTARRQQTISKLLQNTFLPIGYPKSVPDEYTSYQGWNLLQDLCSYLRGVMSTRALLQGMGVGRADITAYQATIQWIFRDGASLLGSLLFTSLTSYNFGQNVKMWRIFADSINNVGITLDLIAPLLPRPWFLPIVCLGSVCKALCGVAAGATGAVINTHFGQLQNNLADVMAKNNAQHNIITLLGLMASIKFATVADKLPGAFTYTSYTILTILHMFSNYRAMKILALKTLNRSRLSILIDQFLTMPSIKTAILQKEVVSNDKAILSEAEAWLKDEGKLKFTPKFVATKEVVLPTFFRPKRSHIQLLTSLSALLKPSSRQPFSDVLQRHDDKYIILPAVENVNVFLMKDASLKDVTKAFFQATLLQSLHPNCVTRSTVLTELLFPMFWQDCVTKNDWQVSDNTIGLLREPDSSYVRISK